MKVIMKRQTRWNGEVLKPGDEADIESTAARRWIDRGIAEPSAFAIKEERADTRPAPTADENELRGTIQLEDLKYNELRKIAKGNDIKVPRGIKKPELIALISGEERAETSPAPTDEKKTV